MSIDLTKHAENGMKAGLAKAGELIQQHFETQQSEWQPLAAATIKIRMAQGFDPGPILVRSGVLKEHVADVQEVTASGNEVVGILKPSQSATVDYGEDKSPISSYAADLDEHRPFFNLKADEDKAAVIEAFKQAFIKSFNNG